MKCIIEGGNPKVCDYYALRGWIVELVGFASCALDLGIHSTKVWDLMIDDNVLSAICSVLAFNSERRETCCIVVFV